MSANQSYIECERCFGSGLIDVMCEDGCCFTEQQRRCITCGGTGKVRFREILSISTIFPDLDYSTKAGFCNQDSKFGKLYFEWEEKIANIAIKNKGYEIIGKWRSTEQDSFGPLGRSLLVKKSGVVSEFFYG